jgi:hypothetical protein
MRLVGLSVVIAALSCAPDGPQPCSYENSACPEGLTCIIDDSAFGNGSCRPPVDAGPQDAGAPDAGPQGCADLECPIWEWVSAAPRQTADTCKEDTSCLCGAAPDVCSGDFPDCTTEGCRSLTTDPANCGVVGNDCRLEISGIAGTGECVRGGCTCDQSPGDDCARAVNVDTCTLVDGQAVCVCADFTDEGVLAACPMEAECVDGGCIVPRLNMPVPTMLDFRITLQI